MEFNIAICDDEMEICSQVENILVDILKELAIKFEIDVFNNGKKLCNELRRTQYDIIFLDIELPEMDGVKVGKYIRETLNNQIIQIAYISSKREYAMELFDYRPINFLIKPLNAEMIKKKVIDKYIALLEKDNYIFTYKKRSEFFKISLSDILYFHNRNRKVTIMTQNGSDEFYDSMEKIYNEVKRYKFLFIHKSIIVNYDYIAKINYKELVMTDGTVFPISQSRRQAVREKFLKIKKGEQ